MAHSARRCLRLVAGAALVLAACNGSPYRTAVVDTHPAGASRAAAPEAGSAAILRFSVASIESPRDTYSAYTKLFDQMGARLRVRIAFEQRRTYREVNDLLIAGRLDAALLCTGGYLDLEGRAPGTVEIVAVPVVAGEESYRSVIIVPASSAVEDIGALGGKRFAFTDELSFSGRLYAERLIKDRGRDPRRFFASVTYTGSHDRSIQAVANGLVDGAAVHGGVLAQMEERDPTLERRVRIVQRSPPLGGMPIVVSKRLPVATRERLREVLLGFHHDPNGAASLRSLRFDRFDDPVPHLYAAAAQLLEP